MARALAKDPLQRPTARELLDRLVGPRQSAETLIQVGSEKAVVSVASTSDTTTLRPALVAAKPMSRKRLIPDLSYEGYMLWACQDTYTLYYYYCGGGCHQIRNKPFDVPVELNKSFRVGIEMRGNAVMLALNGVQLGDPVRDGPALLRQDPAGHRHPGPTAIAAAHPVLGDLPESRDLDPQRIGALI